MRCGRIRSILEAITLPYIRKNHHKHKMDEYPPMFAFKIDKFEYVQGTILTPPGTVWYRAYDQSKPRLLDAPLFFGDMEVAWINAHQPGRALGEFVTTKQLRLLDMRHVMAILPHVLRHACGANMPMENLMLALGLATFRKQIELLEQLPSKEYPWIDRPLQRMRDFAALGEKEKPTWVNRVELQGVRIGITNIDYDVMSWLKALLYPTFDGIVAPALESPFHEQGRSLDICESVMYQELILFNPQQAVEWTGHDRPIKDRMEYYVTTLPFSAAFTNFAFSQSLTNQAVAPSTIRYRSPKRGGSFSDGVFPLIKDETGDLIASDPRVRKQYLKKVAIWMPAVRKIHRNCPWLLKANICLPVAVPEHEL